MDTNFDYDVIFSVAGEQKEYAGKVAQYLIDHGIKVWFYKLNEIELWGKNQVDHFSQIFTKSAKYCVVFISREYTEKVWPNLERQFIQSRWLRDPEYLLPARFDDSLVIGIPDTIGYVSLRGISPEEFGGLIEKKINHTTSLYPQKPVTTFRKPSVKEDFDPFNTRNEWIFSIFSEITRRCAEIKGMSATQDEIEGIKVLRVKFRGETVYSLNIYKRAHTAGDEGISFFGTEGEIRQAGSASNAFGSFVWNKTKNSVVLKLFDLSLFEIAAGIEKEFTKEEFINKLWDRVCDVVDRNY